VGTRVHTAIQNKYVVTNTLSYEKSFGRHNLSGVVGSTYEQNDVIEATVEASDFASDLQLNVTGCYKTTTDSRTNNSRLNGYFARAYDFDSKYLFEVSGRRDGSSRFEKQIR
jgi:hypothetical protein